MFDVVREYKITVRTQFKQAQNLLFLLIMFIVGCVITYYVAEDKILTAIKISVVLFIPQLAGWFIQHANFYSANKCDVFKVDNKGRMELFIHLIVLLFTMIMLKKLNITCPLAKPVRERNI